MRPPLDTGEIGDGVSLAVHDGIIGEIGSIRKYDPINPCDVADMEDPPPVLALFLSSEAIPFMLALDASALYPMTAYQRIYQWPAVGPMPYDGERGVSLPPQEVPLGQTDWPLQPTMGSAISRVSDEVMLELNGQPLDSESVIPQRGMRSRAVWTVRKTMPWVPTVFIRPMPFEGDTKQFTISGIVYDNLGSPLGGVTVRLIMSSMFAARLIGNSIMAEMITDGTGAYSFGVNPSLGYELHAYHEGTNVGGISVDDLAADVVVNIYCTTPGVPPSGGGGHRRVRSVD